MASFNSVRTHSFQISSDHIGAGDTIEMLALCTESIDFNLGDKTCQLTARLFEDVKLEPFLLLQSLQGIDLNINILDPTGEICKAFKLENVKIYDYTFSMSYSQDKSATYVIKFLFDKYSFKE